MGDRRGSNPRQLAPQASALPTELRPPVNVVVIISKIHWGRYYKALFLRKNTGFLANEDQFQLSDQERLFLMSQERSLFGRSFPAL